MNRRNARKNALFLVFQMDFNAQDHFEELKELLEEIDQMISKKAKKWSKERMSKVDLAILRLAIYEICFSNEIPYGVAVNEAVELAKNFSTEESPAFINGILGSIVSEKTQSI